MQSQTAFTPATTEFPLWGGQAVVVASDQAGLSGALAEVERTVAEFDLACSSFRADSEISRLNATPGRPVPVSSLLFNAIEQALTVARDTDGTVDPTVGEALIAHGINPALGGPSFSIRAASGYGVVKLDPHKGTVWLPAGVRLDLGATAKALAADVAAHAAARAAGCGVLVGLCGDIAISGDPPTGGWSIRVTDDHRASHGVGQTVAIQAGGLATSSVTVRRAQGEPAGASHLIDPATGLGVCGPWRTATVRADSCLQANAATTAAIVMGHRAPDWLAARGLAARLVTHDGGVVRVGGWPADGDDLSALT